MTRAHLDGENWVVTLHSAARREAQIRLHALLVKAARAEATRRGPRYGIAGTELDHLAQQAANDALLAIMAKLDQFRGDSKFTTWAIKFVMFEVSTKLGRHYSRHSDVRLDAREWDALPSRFGFDPERESEWRELVEATRRAVEHDLTEHQRRVFVAIVLNGAPLDVVVAEFGMNRNAIYKTLFDARRKLRGVLDAQGLLDRGRAESL